ncbi:O-antigen ligase family protein, partial [Vibrio parahaemolyticus]
MAYVLQSRSGLVGMLAVGGLVAGWMALHRARYLLWLGVASVLLVILTLFVMREVPEVASLFARADAGRFELWRILAGEWLDCGLWLGCGMQHVTEATIGGGAPIQHPHNIYMALGLYSGLVSLLIFLALMVVVLQRAWQQRDPWGLYLFTALVVLNFDGSKLVGNPDELWLLVLLPMA